MNYYYYKTVHFGTHTHTNRRNIFLRFSFCFLSGETILRKKLAKIATKRRRKIGGRYKLNMPLNGDTINADKLSGIAEESEQDVYEGFSPHVDRLQIVLPDPSPTSGMKIKIIIAILFFRCQSV